MVCHNRHVTFWLLETRLRTPAQIRPWPFYFTTALWVGHQVGLTATIINWWRRWLLSWTAVSIAKQIKLRRTAVAKIFTPTVNSLSIPVETSFESHRSAKSAAARRNQRYFRRSNISMAKFTTAPYAVLMLEILHLESIYPRKKSKCPNPRLSMTVLYSLLWKYQV